MLDAWTIGLEAVLQVAEQAAVGATLLAIHGRAVARCSRSKRTAARGRSASRSTRALLPLALGAGVTAIVVGILSGHSLRLDEPGRVLIASAAAPLVGASLWLVRAGRLERRGSWRASRDVAKLVVGPTLLGAFAVLGTALTGNLLRIAGTGVAPPSALWLLSATLLLLGGLAGKPRPWGVLALALQLAASGLAVG